MLCPKCKTNSSDNALACSFCGKALQATPAKKTSKLAVTAFVLSLCGIILPPLFAVPAIILAIVSVFAIQKSSGKLRGQKFAVAAIACSIFSLLILRVWWFDAEPIDDDYTMVDLRSAPVSCNLSYELLMALAYEPNSQKDSVIGLSKQDEDVFWKLSKSLAYKNDFKETGKIAQKHKAQINDLWNKTANARAVIDKLNTFEEVADLSQPYPIVNKMYAFNLTEMAKLYMFHTYLHVSEGNDIDAARELVKFDSVVRKLAVNTRSMLNVMGCFICLQSDITAANYIINNPQTSPEALEILANHYSRLKTEHISFRNAMLGKYLLLGKPFIIGEFQKANGGEVTKPNSLLRLYRNYYNHSIGIIEPLADKKSQLKVWPSFYPDMPSVNYDTGELSFWYKLYNPIGSILMRMTTLKTTSIESKAADGKRIEVENDMFRIALNKRLGREVDLNENFYGNKYMIDKDKRIIFSPGPDKTAYTIDDIELPYDPNVIKF